MRFVIHPAIGIARVGNSEEWYLAPETAGGLPVLANGGRFQQNDFRDNAGRLRRQAVRFQVYSYGPDGSSLVPVEPGKNGVKSIRWTVHVANKKASWYRFIPMAGESGYAPDHPLRNAGQTDRLALIIDPGPRTVEGPGQCAAFDRNCPDKGYTTRFPSGVLQPMSLPIDSLGEIWTDHASRLIFAGGYGMSGTSADQPVIGDFANSDDWWDDTSDGPVTAQVILDGEKEEVYEASAWVTVAPPRYAPQLVSLVTLYDVIFDTSVRFHGFRPNIFSDGMWNQDFEPSWPDHIRPILERAYDYRWVVAVPPKPHSFDWQRLGDRKTAFNAYRQYYLDQIRSPDEPNRFASLTTGLPLMPYLCGDNCLVPEAPNAKYLTLTRTLYFYLRQWAQGKFTTTPAPPLTEGECLDRAALDNCSGGAFSPGIEMSWISRNPQIYESPFRIRLKSRNPHDPLTAGSDLRAGLEAGDISKYQALPWQADFNGCSVQPLDGRFLWWWPVQRPTFVHTGHKKQVAWVGTTKDQNAPDYVQFADDLDMVKKWSQLGFVFDPGTRNRPHFTEVKRTLG